MIGIVLNLACNLDSQDLVLFLLRKGVLDHLLKILVDARHDWPTNGAAVAILHYSHLAL